MTAHRRLLRPLLRAASGERDVHRRARLRRPASRLVARRARGAGRRDAVVRRGSSRASIRRRRRAAAFANSPELLDAELARGFLEIQRAENASLHGPRGNPALWTGEAVFSIISLMIRDFAPTAKRIESRLRRLEALPAFLDAAWHDTASTSQASPSVAPLADEPWTSTARTARCATGAPRSARAAASRRWIAAWIALGADARDRSAASRGRAARAGASGVRDAGCGRHPAAPDDGDGVRPRAVRPAALARSSLHALARRPARRGARAIRRPSARELDAMARDGRRLVGRTCRPSSRPITRRLTSTLEAFTRRGRACRERAEAANVVTGPTGPFATSPSPRGPPTPRRTSTICTTDRRRRSTRTRRTTTSCRRLPAEPDAAEQHLRVWNHSTIKLNHVVHHGAIGHHVQNWHAYHQHAIARRARSPPSTARTASACSAAARWPRGGRATRRSSWRSSGSSRRSSACRSSTRACACSRGRSSTSSCISERCRSTDAVRFYVEQVGMSDRRRAGRGRQEFDVSVYGDHVLVRHAGDSRPASRDASGVKGRAFSLRRFHDELLGYGSIPVPLVARMMTRGSSLDRDERDSSTPRRFGAPLGMTGLRRLSSALRSQRWLRKDGGNRAGAVERPAHRRLRSRARHDEPLRDAHPRGHPVVRRRRARHERREDERRARARRRDSDARERRRRSCAPTAAWTSRGSCGPA